MYIICSLVCIVQNLLHSKSIIIIINYKINLNVLAIYAKADHEYRSLFSYIL